MRHWKRPALAGLFYDLISKYPRWTCSSTLSRSTGSREPDAFCYAHTARILPHSSANERSTHAVIHCSSTSLSSSGT